MCTNALELGPKKRLYIHNWHCHGECALMSGDIEPNHLQCRLHYLLCTLKLPEYMDMPHFEYASEQMLIECVTKPTFFALRKRLGENRIRLQLQDRTILRGLDTFSYQLGSEQASMVFCKLRYALFVLPCANIVKTPT